MKDRLTAVFNLLQRIETKGDSTLMMADCVRELANILQTMSDEPHVHIDPDDPESVPE